MRNLRGADVAPSSQPAIHATANQPRVLDKGDQNGGVVSENDQYPNAFVITNSMGKSTKAASVATAVAVWALVQPVGTMAQQ